MEVLYWKSLRDTVRHFPPQRLGSKSPFHESLPLLSVRLENMKRTVVCVRVLQGLTLSPYGGTLANTEVSIPIEPVQLLSAIRMS